MDRGQLIVDLLGRGAITGHLVYLDDQQPAENGFVRAASTLFQEDKSTSIEADGSFRIGGLPVGPITLTGSDRHGRRDRGGLGV